MLTMKLAFLLVCWISVVNFFTDIILPNIPHFDESDLTSSENVLDALPMYEPIWICLLKVLMHGFKALRKIIFTSTTIKDVFEGLIQMMKSKVAGKSAPQVGVQHVEKRLRHYVGVNTWKVVIKEYYRLFF